MVNKALIVVLLLALGCASQPRPEATVSGLCEQSTDLRMETGWGKGVTTRGVPPEPEKDPPDFQEVQVFYGTDRQRTHDCHPDTFYSATPGKLEFGRLWVTVPKDHRLGELESPSIWRLQFQPDPIEHVVLVAIERLDRNPFFEHLNDVLDRSKKREAFVFIHGYNVPFKTAARRAAQMAYDLHFEGAPVLYSWPSEGNLLAYLKDRKTALASAPQLHRFLEALTQEADVEEVHLIAHSMGNLALTNALKSISVPAEERKMFEEIVLAAPDIDATDFQQNFATRLAATGRRVTLYTSARDRALQIARDYLNIPRAGDSNDGIVIHKDIETVDASLVDTSFIGHSYYGDNRSVMSDIYHLLRQGQPAKMRFGLFPVKTNKGTYWRFAP